MAQTTENKYEDASSSTHNTLPSEVNQALDDAGQSKFIKFADGQTMKLHFYPEQTTTMETTFNGKRDKPTRRFKFMETDHDANIPIENQDLKEWDTGSEVAKELREHFEDNHFDLQVTRRGVDKGTKYRIIPM